MKKLSLFIVLICLLCGCQSVTYENPSGHKMTHRKFIFRTGIESAKYTHPDGTTFELIGYQSESETEKIIEAVARGAVQGAKVQ